ncbi:TetR/AcrR family transcriptional regulator [Pseudomonas sp. TKO26]|uniref:TetR/AcrR family transcriptional regulator n=1 Tax=unclassified Pseudomonas TaxID=196821 RepID=UPI000D832A28|nr:MULTISPECIES: TetR family transcriptional regulator [unclassified Pseudomonas]PYY81943.1 TetR/AcrR family transcriptional regulator [Pseudomonas sp. TKO30]PYY83466.1 TetR/AcrR family transcriptional regulator [Pseudomonas sp. TKO29]PYY85210.1 TetR/AcrR family transcriptional regulator [Pseudomonas sp. TKO26]PYY97859.1 TetR/AcrR family transcriptional regulator [Pseudomonas sp. TKO14]
MARMGAEVRRQDFIEATVKVIAQYGVANATTRRIAAEAKSPLASLHYTFHTKDELFYAVYESLISTPQQAVAHVTPSATTEKTVAELLRQAANWFVTHPDLAIAQSELFAWTLRNNPAMATQIYSYAGLATEQAIERVIGSRLDKAALTKTSRLLINLLDGLLISWSAHGNIERLNEETDTACHALELVVASIESIAETAPASAKSSTDA